MCQHAKYGVHGYRAQQSYVRRKLVQVIAAFTLVSMAYTKIHLYNWKEQTMKTIDPNDSSIARRTYLGLSAATAWRALTFVALGCVVSLFALALDIKPALARPLMASDACIVGYVWRDAYVGDRVCVTPETHDQAAYDNSQATNRLAINHLPYGPNTCVQGYVWREAYSGDQVCVTEEIRAQAAHDNSLADERRQPGGGPYGPDTCVDGYVWRGTIESDHVCVTPETRDQTAYDNSQAEARRATTFLVYFPTMFMPRR